MIQRIQSIWLLLAVIAAILTFKFSFYSGNIAGPDQVKVFKSLVAPGNIAILVITVAVAVMALVAIFLYKNRVLQMRLSLAAMVLSLLNIVLYYNQTLHFIEGNFDLTALISLSIPVFLVLAVKGIYNDQKLVKSLDRLR
jgi:Domain of unknown function (DUF4293)